ncbi:2'-5' RNA ligase family protein [Calidifontibacter sp. DB0510]|uniref:2'-5' RNA ligase family protein n=1 Tax=Metallococcus carri TaxID=1656884 RepID=A0A967B865_9MICO|nr:2'-5' RNA ligase family protein [Metallococcus carri]NHN56561.1 2'-5' RNA ligase family protein [Metallococcus carri]NOP38860.1 2'-5' RNA ligase family protein [Calidifontibacter sp. DB2511S]
MRTVGVSIPIPPPYGARLAAAREAAGDPLAHAVPPHVTLLPPTEVAKIGLEDFETHLREVAARHTAFRMTLRGTGSFRPISPVVFVAVAEGIGQCELLQAQVRSGPVDRALEFPYHPHVTIAQNVPEERLQAAFDELATFDASFEVDGFDLYHQHEDGVWQSVRRFTLAAANVS